MKQCIETNKIIELPTLKMANKLVTIKKNAE